MSPFEPNEVPRDVASQPLNDAELRDYYLAANERFANGPIHGTVTLPGEVIEDVDGIPLSVGPTRSYEGSIGAPVVTLALLHRLGLTVADVPNLPVLGEDYHLINNPAERNE